MAKRDEIPFRARLDLPETLPVDEIDMCLVLSNLLENALEASLRTAPGRRQIEITACVHADRILLIEVEMRLTVRSTKRTAFSAPPSGGKTVSVSSPSPVLRRKPVAQVRLPIKMAPFPPKSCSADKRIFRAYPDNARYYKPQGVRAAVPCFYEIRKERSNTMEQLLRQRAESIWTAAIRSVLPDEAVRRALDAFSPGRGRVFRRGGGQGACRWPTRRWPCWAV